MGYKTNDSLEGAGNANKTIRRIDVGSLKGKTCRLAGHVGSGLLNRLRAVNAYSPDVRLGGMCVNNRSAVMYLSRRMRERYSRGQCQGRSDDDAK